MVEQKVSIWIWIQDEQLYKALYSEVDETLTIVDERDNIVFKRTGITQDVIQMIESCFLKIGAKKLNDHQSFTYL